MSKLDFEQRQRANELVDRIGDDLEEYAFQIVFLEAENERLRAELSGAKLPGRNSRAMLPLLQEISDRDDQITRLAAETERLRTALDKLPSRMTPDEDDGEPDYYADGWNDCLDAMIAIRERK